jgi:hypothetical protein
MVAPYAGNQPVPAARAGTAIFIPVTNAIERLHEEFKRRIKTQTVLPSAETAAMLFWALLAAGQITMRKVDGWQTLTHKLADEPIDPRCLIQYPRSIGDCARQIPTQIATAPDAGTSHSVGLRGARASDPTAAVRFHRSQCRPMPIAAIA